MHKQFRTGSHATGAIRTIKRGAFTLIEMMIVLVILITLIAILLPVISGARSTAKKVSTMQLMSNLQSASSSFELDERRAPGYFTQAQMGDAANDQRGFTQMQNILLDLSGGVIANITSLPGGGTRVNVGPVASSAVTVDVSLVNAPIETKGVTKNSYYTVDRKYWTSMSGVGQKFAAPEHITLPDLVDAFGNPFLAWVEDETAGAGAAFAAVDSSTRARFYWTANAGFLKATALGAGGVNQTDPAVGSMLSTAAWTPQAVAYSMHGLLGSPAFPAAANDANNRRYPTAPRGKVIFQSAGLDGAYLGAKDRGGVVARGAANGNPPPGHQLNVVDYRGNNGDPLDLFDDIINVSGN